MRHSLILLLFTLVGGFLVACSPPPLDVRVLTKSLGIPSGLAYDGKQLLVTDLAEGSIYRLSRNGRLQLLATDLPYGIDILGAPTGPYKIAWGDNRLMFTQGWQPQDKTPHPYDHSVLELTPQGQLISFAANFWNPYDLEWDGENWYLTDAGRNSLFRLDSVGQSELLYAFPRLELNRSDLSSLSPTEFSEEQPYSMDAVPTGIALTKDRVFVALFGGFPYTAASGYVVSIGKENPADFRIEFRGLNAPIDLAFDEQGRLLILELGEFDLEEQRFRAGSGSLLSAELREHSIVKIKDGLNRPVTVVPISHQEFAIAEMDGRIILISTSR